MYAIFNLLTNTITTGFAFIGVGAFIIKVGNLFKIIEQNKEDGFKKGFDIIMLESIDEMNKCVDSITLITNNITKIIFILYDIIIGNKFIKKNKDGKIVISTKSNTFSSLKEKIEELKSKVKNYEQEINKIKKEKTDKNLSEDESLSEDDESLSEDDESLSEDNDLSVDESLSKDKSLSDNESISAHKPLLEDLHPVPIYKEELPIHKELPVKKPSNKKLVNKVLKKKNNDEFYLES